MKRLGIYILIVVCIMACRKEKSGISISGEDFLNQVFPTYSFHDEGSSEIVDAVVAFDTARFLVNDSMVMKFMDPNLNKHYFGYIAYDSENGLLEENQQYIFETALEYLSNSKADLDYYMVQILDNRTPKYDGKLRKDYKEIDFFKKLDHYPISNYYAFDKPLFTLNKKKALIHSYHSCGLGCGSGVIYFLELNNGKWIVTGLLDSYIS